MIIAVFSYMAIGWIIGLIFALLAHMGFGETLLYMASMGIVWPAIVGMVVVMGIAG